MALPWSFVFGRLIWEAWRLEKVSTASSIEEIGEPSLCQHTSSGWALKYENETSIPKVTIIRQSIFSTACIEYRGFDQYYLAFNFVWWYELFSGRMRKIILWFSYPCRIIIKIWLALPSCDNLSLEDFFLCPAAGVLVQAGVLSASIWFAVLIASDLLDIGVRNPALSEVFEQAVIIIYVVMR